MIIDRVHLVIALILLCLPRQALRLGRRFTRSRRRRRGKGFDFNPSKIREPGDQTVSFRVEFAKLRNYVDFLRAGLGGVMLLGALPLFEPAIRAADDATGNLEQTVFYGRLLVLAAAVMIQSFRFENRLAMFAPIFYLAGLTISLCGPAAAGFALVLIWVINFALPGPSAFLSIYAIVIALFGTLFPGTGTPPPLYTGILCFLPVLVSLLIRRPLVMFAKKIRPGGPAVTS